MIKRILGFILFVWMGISFVGLLREIGDHSGTRFWTNVAIGMVTLALAVVGLLLTLGKTQLNADASEDQEAAP